MKKLPKLFFKALGIVLLLAISYKMADSALDVYNNFVYDKAILRATPYGYISLLKDPNNYTESAAEIKGGDFVYVENWESAANERVVFAKVKSKFSSGYVNKRLLVQANMNVMPILSVLLLGSMLAFLLRWFYLKINHNYSFKIK